MSGPLHASAVSPAHRLEAHGRDRSSISSTSAEKRGELDMTKFLQTSR